MYLHFSFTDCVHVEIFNDAIITLLRIYNIIYIIYMHMHVGTTIFVFSSHACLNVQCGLIKTYTACMPVSLIHFQLARFAVHTAVAITPTEE